MTDYIITGFFWLAMLLLGGVTLGVGYLTFSEWQDRRRNRN
jgi:hypothetical protein